MVEGSFERVVNHIKSTLMYFAVDNLTTRDFQGYEITRYRKGDSISNWKYFWMKKRYKRYFAKAEVFIGLPEEDYRMEVQERDSDLSDMLVQNAIIAEETRLRIPSPIEEWYPHDDHMLVTHRREIFDEGIPLGQPMDDIPLVNPTEEWQDAVTPQIDMDTTTFDDPAQQEPMYGPDPNVDIDVPSPIQDTTNDNSYDSSSDYSSSSSDSSYDSGSSSDYSSSDSSSDSGGPSDY